MRVFASVLIALLSVVDLAWAQASATPTAQASATPSKPAAGLTMFRPVLIGQGPSALINRIDEQELIRKGQKDALVMFLCTVRKDGGVEWSATYRGTPDSDFLKQELQKRISPASNPKFIPAVHDHQPVDAIYYGTVTFRVVNGKPRLRIFSNQEAGELEKEHDFIGPQPFFGDGSGFTGFHYPPMESGRLQVDGKVELKDEGRCHRQFAGDKCRFGEPASFRFWRCGSQGFRRRKIHSRVSGRQTGRIRSDIVGLLQSGRLLRRM